MAAISTAIGLGLGAASMGFGLFERMEGQERAEEGYALQQQGLQIQAQAASARAGVSKEQAASSVEFAGRNRDLELTAAQQSEAAALQSQQINREIVGYERQAEAQRRQAMEMDARRRQTEIIRNQQRARSLGLAAATSQGASRGTGLQGGYGQISGQTGTDILGVQQNLQIGRNIFDINANITNQRLAASDLETLYAQQRAALTTARSQMAYDYASINAGYQTRMADIDTFASQGAGYTSQGSGMVSQGQSQISSGTGWMNMGMQLPGMFNTLGNVAQANFFRPTASSSISTGQMGFGQYGYRGIY